MAEQSVISPQAQSSQASPAGEASLLYGNDRAELLLGFSMLPIQRMLAVGSPNDPMEDEADKMADRVMRMPEPFVQRKCAACENEDEEKINRKTISSEISPFVRAKGNDNGGAVSPAVANRIADTKGSGSPLPSNTLSFMESRFGTDFSGVKIHTGDDAADLSSRLNAQAFTVGSDIYFNEGKYAPESFAGKQLLAHELTHTIQQSSFVNRMIRRVPDLAPVTIRSGGYGAAAQQLASQITEDAVRNNARVMVAIGSSLQVFDGHGASVGHSIHLTRSIPLSNGIFKSMGNPPLFYQIYHDSEGRLDLIRASHTDKKHARDTLNLHTYISPTDNDYFNGLLGNIPHWFLVLPGAAGGSGGQRTTPGWATSQVSRVQTRMQRKGQGTGTGTGEGQQPATAPTPDHTTPDRLVPWVDDHGVHVNAWKDGYHTTVNVNEGESDETLINKIANALQRAFNAHDFGQSERVHGDVTQTGFQAQPHAREFERSGMVADPEQRRLALNDSQRIANWPAYPAHIDNYGNDITVVGGNNRMQMVLDYGMAGAGLLNQVTARMQPINYFWEIFNVSAVPTDQVEAVEPQIPTGVPGAYIGAGSGAGNQLSRGMHQIYEDQAADIRGWADAGLLNLPLWQVRVAQLQLMALSSVVRTVGNLVSSYVSIVTTPLNEKNIGWDGEGEFLIRCIATPSHDPDSPNIRASSIGVKVIKVMKVNARAEQELSKPEEQLANLRRQLASAPEGPQRDAILRQIQALEQSMSQTVMENVAGQLQTANRNVEVVNEVIRYRQDNTVHMSVPARLLNVQLQLNNIDPVDYLHHMQEQLEVMHGMQTYGNSMLTGAKTGAPVYKPRVSLASEENGQVYNMVMMVFETSASTDAHRRYRVVDLSSPNTQGHYDGDSTAEGAAGHTEALRNAFIAFGENNGYGRGAIAIRFTQPLPEGVTAPGNGRSAPGARGRWMQRLSDLASVAEIAGLLVTGPAGMAIGLAGGLASAAVAAEGLMRRSHDGRFRWTFQTFMDIVGVVGGIVPLLGTVNRMQGAVHIFGIAQMGTSALALPVTLIDQLNDIRMDMSLPQGEKDARSAEAFLHAVRSGTVLVLTARQMAQNHPSPAGQAAAEPTAETGQPAEPVRVLATPDGGVRPLETNAPAAEANAPGSARAADHATAQPEANAPAAPAAAHAEPQANPAESHPANPNEGHPSASREGTPVEVEGDLPRRAANEHPTEGQERPAEDTTGRPAENNEERRTDENEETGAHPVSGNRPPPRRAAAILRLQSLIQDLLTASPIREPFNMNDPAQRSAAVRHGNVQAARIIRTNPELLALARETLREVGSFKDLRSLIGDGFFGFTNMHNTIAREALQTARMEIANSAMHSAIQTALEFVRARYPGIDLQVRQLDLGTPGFGSDRDVTLQFRGGGGSEMASRARIEASLKAVQEAYSNLRAQGIEPDSVLDTNFYTELHESSIRASSPLEAAQINFDQSVVSLSEQRMGMTGEQWTAFKQGQLERFSGEGRSEAEARINADARARTQAEFDAAEALAARLRPEGQSVAQRNTLLNNKMTELSQAVQRGDSPRAIRQLMAEIKLLEPEAYGTRAAVESVVGNQQRLARGTSGDYMTGRKLPAGRAERLSFLTQDATANNGFLHGHTKVAGNEVSHVRAGAKYLGRVSHAVTVDGKLGAGRAERFMANLRNILATKNIFDATEASVAVMREVRAALIADGMSAEVVNQTADAALRDMWADKARQYGNELAQNIRTVEQTANAHEPGPLHFEGERPAAVPDPDEDFDNPDFDNF